MDINQVLSKINKEINEKEEELNNLKEEIKTLLTTFGIFGAFFFPLGGTLSIAINYKIVFLVLAIVYFLSSLVTMYVVGDFETIANIKLIKKQIKLLKDLEKETKENYKNSKEYTYNYCDEPQSFCEKQEQKIDMINFYGKNQKKLKKAIRRDYLDDYLLTYEISNIQVDYLKSILNQEDFEKNYVDDMSKKKSSIIKKQFKKNKK